MRAAVFEVPSILTAESLLDKAFGRAAKATATGPDRIARARNLAVARVRGAGQTIESTLRGYVKGFPSSDRLPPFYRELVDVLVDLGRLKKHLGALDWAPTRSVRSPVCIEAGSVELRAARSPSCGGRRTAASPPSSSRSPPTSRGWSTLARPYGASPRSTHRSRRS